METSRAELEGLINLFDSCNSRKYADSDDENLENEENPVENSSINQTERENPENQNPYAKLDPEKEKERKLKEITDENEFFFDDEKPNIDWKKTPKWELSYKQQVTSSDVFLQMGPKNPSTASCEDMVIEISLPNDKRQNIDLKIEHSQLKLFSPNHALDIPLPHPVDPQKGKAEWDSNTEKLIVTLKMQREFDFINF